MIKYIFPVIYMSFIRFFFYWFKNTFLVPSMAATAITQISRYFAIFFIKLFLYCRRGQNGLSQCQDERQGCQIFCLFFMNKIKIENVLIIVLLGVQKLYWMSKKFWPIYIVVTYDKLWPILYGKLLYMIWSLLCGQEVVTTIYIMSYYINRGNYFLNTGYFSNCSRSNGKEANKNFIAQSWQSCGSAGCGRSGSWVGCYRK